MFVFLISRVVCGTGGNVKPEFNMLFLYAQQHQMNAFWLKYLTNLHYQRKSKLIVFFKNKKLPLINNQVNNAECFQKPFSFEIKRERERKSLPDAPGQDEKHGNILLPVQHSCHLLAFNELSQIPDQISDLKCLSCILSSQGIKFMLDNSSVWDTKVGGTQDNQAISDLPDAPVDSFPSAPPWSS